MQNKVNSLLISIAIHFLMAFIVFTIVDNIFPEINIKNEEKRYSINLNNINLTENIKSQNKSKKVIFINEEKKKKEKILKDKNKSKQTKNNKYSLEKLKPTARIKASYGDTFEKLTRREQQYILDNWSEINELNELFSPKILPEDKDKFKVGDHETVIFYLNTDGTISDISFVENNNSDFKEAIGKSIIQSYKYFKRPRVKTLMKIRVDIKAPLK